MPVKKEPTRRALELEFELPGTPEQIWQAIATGPGFASWFVPSEIEEREGGAVSFDLGQGMSSAGKVTVWEPLRRFGIEESGWNGEAPPLATEFVIEARSGDTCKVKLVSSLFTSDDRWDDELEGMERGWTPFFNVLRLYLLHFAGARSASIRLMGAHAGTIPAAIEALGKALGLAGAAAGEQRSAPQDAPALAGLVEHVYGGGRQHEWLLRLSAPAPGVALIGAFPMNEQAMVALSLYFYGDQAAALTAREEPRWQAWVAERFPLGPPPSA